MLHSPVMCMCTIMVLPTTESRSGHHFVGPLTAILNLACTAFSGQGSLHTLKFSSDRKPRLVFCKSARTSIGTFSAPLLWPPRDVIPLPLLTWEEVAVSTERVASRPARLDAAAERDASCLRRSIYRASTSQRHTCNSFSSSRVAASVSEATFARSYRYYERYTLLLCIPY